MSKIGSAVSEEKSFENVNGRTDGQTDDGRKVITIAHPEQSSGELKISIFLSKKLSFLVVKFSVYLNRRFHNSNVQRHQNKRAVSIE